MSEQNKRRWSYGAALAISLVTFYVFYVFQNFGPESTIRRFHNITNRVVSYYPTNLPFTSTYLRPEDAAELGFVTVQGSRSPSLVSIMDGWIRPAAYAGASYDIVRINYETPSLVIAVVEYRYPEAQGPGYTVWVVRLQEQSWRIDLDRTRTLADSIGSSVRFGS